MALTSDVVALVRNEPDIPTVVEGMIAFGEALRMREAGPGARHLYDSEGRLLVSIEAPELVRVPGEVARLLGPQMADRVRLPVWWVEIRAAAGLPEARRVARRFADDLVHWQGGAVWPPVESR
ncbi:hypothetical protein GCM10023191_013630 [Actinoallomurus oryzae]|uniref:Uncharacterized protein n=1 Tax=Actinoallomurus oryzae TaxID=502180 RepID=A0ABP8PHX1_9ACTN